MNKFNKARVTIFSKIGAYFEKIEKIPENMYNRLRCKYHNKLPASYYLLFNVPNNNPILKQILFTTVLPKEADYRIVAANTSVFGDYIYIECDDVVYDVILDTKMDKKFFEMMFGVSDKKIITKEEILDYIESFQIAKDTIDDCQDVDISILDSIDEQYKNYEGKRKSLIKRQVESFFSDMRYEDGLMYITIK